MSTALTNSFSWPWCAPWQACNNMRESASSCVHEEIESRSSSNGLLRTDSNCNDKLLLFHIKRVNESMWQELVLLLSTWRNFCQFPGIGVPEPSPLCIPLPYFVTAVLFRVFYMYLFHTKFIQIAFWKCIIECMQWKYLRSVFIKILSNCRFQHLNNDSSINDYGAYQWSIRLIFRLI